VPLVSAAEAAGTPAAEALAVGVIRAMAGACGPRDMYVMVLEALQTRVRAVTDAAAAANHVDEDQDDDGSYRLVAAKNGWRLAGALASALATLVSRLTRKQTVFVMDAVPLVRALAAAANEVAEERRERAAAGSIDRGGDEARTCDDIANDDTGWSLPEEAIVGVYEFLAVAATAVSAAADADSAAAIASVRALALSVAALDPTRQPRINPSLLATLRCVGISNLDQLCTFVHTASAAADEAGEMRRTRVASAAEAKEQQSQSTSEESDEDDSESDEDDPDNDGGDQYVFWPPECVVGAALVAHAWLVSAEEEAPHPSPLTPGGPLHRDEFGVGDAESAPLCASLSLGALAGLVDALLPSPLAPGHFAAGLQLAALAFRRAPRAAEDEATTSDSHAVMAMLTKLEVTMAHVPEAGLGRSPYLDYFVMQSCLVPPSITPKVADTRETVVLRLLFGETRIQPCRLHWYTKPVLVLNYFSTRMLVTFTRTVETLTLTTLA